MDWMRFAETVDALRVVPRFMVLAYGFVCWEVGLWFMALPDPSASQAAFVSSIAGVAGAVFTFYVKSGRKWDA